MVTTASNHLAGSIPQVDISGDHEVARDVVGVFAHLCYSYFVGQPLFYAPLEEVVTPAARWMREDRPARFESILSRHLKQTFLLVNRGNCETA